MFLYIRFIKLLLIKSKSLYYTYFTCIIPKVAFCFRAERTDVPTFHTCFSKQTEPRPQVRLFTGLAGWKLPRASLWKSWHLNMWLSRSGQKPAVFERAKCQTQCWQRATLAKCVVVNCHEGVFQIMNRIQYDSDVNPGGCSSVQFCSFVRPCVTQMWVLTLGWREAK